MGQTALVPYPTKGGEVKYAQEKELTTTLWERLLSQVPLLPAIACRILSHSHFT